MSINQTHAPVQLHLIECISKDEDVQNLTESLDKIEDIVAVTSGHTRSEPYEGETGPGIIQLVQVIFDNAFSIAAIAILGKSVSKLADAYAEELGSLIAKDSYSLLKRNLTSFVKWYRDWTGKARERVTDDIGFGLSLDLREQPFDGAHVVFRLPDCTVIEDTVAEAMLNGMASSKIVIDIGRTLESIASIDDWRRICVDLSHKDGSFERVIYEYYDHSKRDELVKVSFNRLEINEICTLLSQSRESFKDLLKSKVNR